MGKKIAMKKKRAHAAHALVQVHQQRALVPQHRLVMHEDARGVVRLSLVQARARLLDVPDESQDAPVVLLGLVHDRASELVVVRRDRALRGLRDVRHQHRALAPEVRHPERRACPSACGARLWRAAARRAFFKSLAPTGGSFCVSALTSDCTHGAATCGCEKKRIAVVFVHARAR